ncbi:MAG: PEP-utilizing enzyme, partial [Actinomycetes bacterium]
MGPGQEAIEDLVGQTDQSDPDAVADALFAISSAMVDAVVLGLDTLPDDPDGDLGPVLVRGLGVSPGVAAGLVRLNAEDLLDMVEDGVPCVLWVEHTGPEDEPAMREAAAIVTTAGGPASHAAILARQLGIPAVCGVGDVEYPSSAFVTVDGSTGTISLGLGTATAPLDELPDALATLLDWADDVVGGRVQVAVNAETAEDVHLARAMGAQAVGLCRTEHQFLGERAGLVAPLVDGTATDEQLAAFVDVQSAALFDVLIAADGIPVKVRLLDAPAGEFLPAAPPGLRHLRGARLALARPQVV